MKVRLYIQHLAKNIFTFTTSRWVNVSSGTGSPGLSLTKSIEP